MNSRNTLATMFHLLAPHLDERQRRLFLAAEAQALGRGGISQVAAATGVSRQTIRNGLRELEEPAQPPLPYGRARREGAGRKTLRERDPELLAVLDLLVGPSTRGHCTSPLLWTCKSTRQLAQALTDAGHPVGRQVVSELLRDQGYSLQGNAETKDGLQHPYREAQFQYINDKVWEFLTSGLPVLFVDAKKKKLPGEHRKADRNWQAKGQPEEVKMPDFVAPALGNAIPYGPGDEGRHHGWVNVSPDHDTVAFAVQSMRRWWRGEGALLYPHAKELMICPDSGANNGFWAGCKDLWKYDLGRWAADEGLAVTVCHLPPGTIKWNKIELRLFAHTSMGWCDQPPAKHEVAVNLINIAGTPQAQKVYTQRANHQYPTRINSSADRVEPNLKAHDFHEEWNYIILP